MELITYPGAIAAVAGATRAYLAPHIDALADQHPVEQFVLELCLYAHRLAHGELTGEPAQYLPGRAERYVREQRMPAELFRMRAHLRDDERAELFNVPVWEVATRRREPQTMRRPARRCSPTRGRRGAGAVCRGPAAMERLSAAAAAMRSRQQGRRGRGGRMWLIEGGLRPPRDN